jgi:hypothetical protein
MTNPASYANSTHSANNANPPINVIRAEACEIALLINILINAHVEFTLSGLTLPSSY